MSDLEKIVTIAKNQEKVYHAGAIKYALTNTTEKSEFISVTDSSDYKLLDLKMDGKSEQETYSGKNLFNKNNCTILDGWIDEDTLQVYAHENFRTVGFQIEGGKTYTVSKASGMRFIIFDAETDLTVDSKPISCLVKNNTATSLTVTPSAKANYLYILYWYRGEDTLTDAEIIESIQVELGSTATEYEPYVGGMRSPNPYYPQEIQSLKNVEIKVSGNNQTPQSVTLTSQTPITKWDSLCKRNGVWGWSINTLQHKLSDYEWLEGALNNNGNGPTYYTKRYDISSEYLESLCRYLSENNISGQVWESLDVHQYFINQYIVVCTSHNSLEKFQQWINENEVTIICKSEEEQAFIPLTDSEQRAMNKLTTYYGGTNISNDQGCTMRLSYIVDPDTYGGDL